MLSWDIFLREQNAPPANDELFTLSIRNCGIALMSLMSLYRSSLFFFFCWAFDCDLVPAIFCCRLIINSNCACIFHPVYTYLMDDKSSNLSSKIATGSKGGGGHNGKDPGGELGGIRKFL